MQRRQVESSSVVFQSGVKSISKSAQAMYIYTDAKLFAESQTENSGEMPITNQRGKGGHHESNDMQHQAVYPIVLCIKATETINLPFANVR